MAALGQGRPLRASVTGASRMTPGRAALVGLMDRFIRALLDPYLTLLEVHKLLYFLQKSGEPLRLQYVKAPYGPYAENLRHVLHAIEGHFVSGYADGGDAPDKELVLVPGAADDAQGFLADHPQTQARFDRVAALVKGFESAFGLELLATVHWVAAENPAAATEEIIAGVYAWDERKRRFTERHIKLALERLGDEGWLVDAAGAGA